MKECPPPVLELVSYLGKSGTGKAKLEALIQLGCKCDGAEEFLAKAPKVVPEGTMAKINTYLASIGQAKQLPLQDPTQPTTEPEPTIPPQEETKGEEGKEEVVEEGKSKKKK